MSHADATLAELILEAQATVDDDTRADLWRQAERRVLESGACIPLYSVRRELLVRSSTHEQELDALGYMDMSRVWMEP